MIGLHPFELALLSAVVLAGLEVVTGTFILLGFAVGCLAVSAAEFLSGQASVTRDALLFAAFAVLAIVVSRRTFARSGDTTRIRGDVNDY